MEQEQVQGEQKWLRHGTVRQRDGARRSLQRRAVACVCGCRTGGA
jgi:hypothetical protein